MRLLLPALVAALCLGPGCLADLTHDDVVASFYPLQFLAQQIAGGHASVGVLVPAGVEPHDYDLKPSDLARVESARLVVYQGLGLEAFGPTLAAFAADHGKSVLPATQGIPTRQASGDEGTGGDPHMWLDPVLAAREAHNIEAALALADPANASAYRQSDARLGERLNATDQAFRNTLAHCDNRRIITTHAAFGYLGARYNFTQYGISGFEPDAEPSADTLRDTADLARRENIHVIFFETLVSPKVAQIVASEIHGEARVLDPIEGLTPAAARGGQDYFTLLNDDLQALAGAMGCHA